VSAGESRWVTIGTGAFALGSVALFAVVFAPALAGLEPGSGVRPWGGLPLIAVFVGSSGWLACAIAGACQLLARPRWYGLLTLAFGALQLLAFRLTEWALMGSRGLYWAP
jgi:hypothetical protein